MSAVEGFCKDCGQPVRRWATSTGWKHVSGRHRWTRCPKSPPDDVEVLPTQEPPQ